MEPYSRYTEELLNQIEKNIEIRKMIEDDYINSHLTKKEREANHHPIRTEPKYYRNETCPCGSGKKYKKCCLK
jgi:uncharacterized protein YecA (UPF0149 family)